MTAHPPGEEFRSDELALLRFMHALIGKTIAEADLTSIRSICNRPASGGGRFVDFVAVLGARDESGNRFPIELTVHEIPASLLMSESPMLSDYR